MIHLSPRLTALAELVPPDAKIADVGTDHGYLAIWLARNRSPVSVVATDVRPGPLDSARRHIAEEKLDNLISLRLCDGLEAVSPEEADVILIAGMGGETILGILSRAPWALSDRLLILQPQSKQTELRRWLYEHDCGIREERLVEDNGKIYPIFTVCGKAEETPDDAALYLGFWPEEKRDALFYEYLARNIRKLERERAGSAQSQRTGNAAQTERLDGLLNALRAMRKGEEQ